MTKSPLHQGHRASRPVSFSCRTRRQATRRFVASPPRMERVSARRAHVVSHPTESSGAHLGSLPFVVASRLERYRDHEQVVQFAPDFDGFRWPLTVRLPMARALVSRSFGEDARPDLMKAIEAQDRLAAIARQNAADLREAVAALDGSRKLSVLAG